MKTAGGCGSSGDSEKMQQLLVVLVALVLPSCSRQSSDFCSQKTCPEYRLVESNEDFEVRHYVATDWISTKVDGAEGTDVVAAAQRLKDYCSSLKETGEQIQSSWPALITLTGDEDDPDPDLSLSWFVPPALKPQAFDTSVSLLRRDAATVYVRSFGGTPGPQSGLENARILREALVNAGKAFRSGSFDGATYDSYLSLSHHNEIWIYAA